MVDGSVTGGTLRGDLILEGRGDVELDMDDLMAFVLAMRRAGIEDVAGRFLIDDDAFLRAPVIDERQPPDAPYNAGIGPLSLAFNRVTAIPEQGRWRTLPPLTERGPAWPIVIGLRPERARPLPVRDAGLHTARVLRRLAGDIGITLPEPQRGTSLEAKEIVRAESKPVRALVQDMLLYSNNQLAETLGLLASTRLGGAPVSLAGSAGALADHVAATSGMDEAGLELRNHSGLSSRSRATPAQLAALLRFGLERFDLIELLPASGWSGSLEKRLAGGAAALRVWAKTGSLDFASALAGYLLTGQGLLIFVIMVADETERAAYDAMPIPTPAIRARADRWEIEARALQDSLVEGWLAEEGVRPD